MDMYKVTDRDGLVYGLVDTRDAADRIVDMKKLGRNGASPPITNMGNITKAGTMQYKIEIVPAKGNHPGY